MKKTTLLPNSFRQSLIDNPVRWSPRAIFTTLVIGAGAATILGLIQVSLRYDSTDSERWFTYYFFNQLIAWGQWMLWTPLFILSINKIIKQIKKELQSYAIVICTALALAFVATTIEAFLWHTFYNTSPEWYWSRVWKASISNNYDTHFLFAFSIILLVVIRQFILISRGTKLKQPHIRTGNGDIDGSLIVRHQGKTEFIPLKDISHISASGSYVEIFSAKHKTTVTGTLKQYATQLPSTHFVRIHRSFIVRIDKVSKLTPLTNEDYQVTTMGGHQLRLSRSYKQALPILKGAI